jgi:hypothetical protein
MATEPRSQQTPASDVSSARRAEKQVDVPSAKRAAIDLDAIGERTLDEVKASDFLEALNAGGMAIHYLAVWPEKKKVELWAERETVGRIPVKDVIEVVRTEKKKQEREPYLGVGREGLINPPNEVLGQLVREIDSLKSKVAQLAGGGVIVDG